MSLAQQRERELGLHVGEEQLRGAVRHAPVDLMHERPLRMPRLEGPAEPERLEAPV